MEDPEPLIPGEGRTHVCSSTFGENISEENALREVITTSPKVCSTDAQLLLMEAYETTYGIFDHDNFSRPLSLVAMHSGEENAKSSKLYERFRQFRTKNVFKHFGINLLEFLSMPTEYCNYVLELAEEASKEEDIVATNLANHLKEVTGR